MSVMEDKTVRHISDGDYILMNIFQEPKSDEKVTFASATGLLCIVWGVGNVVVNKLEGQQFKIEGVWKISM